MFTAFFFHHFILNLLPIAAVDDRLDRSRFRVQIPSVVVRLKKLIISGGVTHENSEPEAAVMLRALVDRGISEQIILIENEATSSFVAIVSAQEWVTILREQVRQDWTTIFAEQGSRWSGRRLRPAIHNHSLCRTNRRYYKLSGACKKFAAKSSGVRLATLTRPQPPDGWAPFLCISTRKAWSR